MAMPRIMAMFGAVLLTGTCLLAVRASAANSGASASPSGEVIFLENFEGEGDWTHSANEKYNGRLIKVKDAAGDTGMRVPTQAMHYGSGVKLAEPIDLTKGFTFQYEVLLTSGLECGGAYVKLLSETSDLTLTALDGDTPYSIMFGPDKCGTTNKVHLIIRHKSPKTGEVEEKHLVETPTVKFDMLPHVYTLTIKPDNSYEILIDNEVAKEGSLFEDFQPPFNPPAEIDDPEDFKPADWVDEEEVVDSEDEKPEEWDEEAARTIVDEEAQMPAGWLEAETHQTDDPEAEMPDDWDEEEDGVFEPAKIDNPLCSKAPGCGPWERPSKANPAYKGKWSPRMVPNPAYKGEWAPAQIPNPALYEDLAPMSNVAPIGAAAVEIWTMNSGIVFDNFLATYDAEVADDFAEKTWRVKFDAAKMMEAEDTAKELGMWGDVLVKFKQLSNSWIFKPLRPYFEPIVDNAMKHFNAELMMVAFIAIPLVLVWPSSSSAVGTRPKSKPPKRRQQPRRVTRRRRMTRRPRRRRMRRWRRWRRRVRRGRKRRCQSSDELGRGR